MHLFAGPLCIWRLCWPALRRIVTGLSDVEGRELVGEEKTKTRVLFRACSHSVAGVSVTSLPALPGTLVSLSPPRSGIYAVASLSLPFHPSSLLSSLRSVLFLLLIGPLGASEPVAAVLGISPAVPSFLPSLFFPPFLPSIRPFPLPFLSFCHSLLRPSRGVCEPVAATPFNLHLSPRPSSPRRPGPTSSPFVSSV